MTIQPASISVTDLRNSTREILENAHFRSRQYLVMRAGQPMAIILGVDEYERLVAASRAADSVSETAQDVRRMSGTASAIRT